MKTTFLSLILATAQWSVLAGNDSPENYVAHEWGTFTSVQGADGVLIPWNPLETTKLPKFVYDWSKPGQDRLPAGVLKPGSKSAFVTLQRMETPVIYFYSDTERTIDVTVRFPQGLITEWYPQAHDIGPSAFPPNKLATALDGLVRQTGAQPRFTIASLFGRKGVPDSRIRWKSIRVLPSGRNADLAAVIPTDTSGIHYFAARETDAAFVRVKAPDKAAPATEHEKFLFYRGVANFKTPLQITFNSGNEANLFLRNTGTDELKHLFVLAIRQGQGKFIYEDHVPSGQHVYAGLKSGEDLLPLGELAARISGRMSAALQQEGLYRREADAMVKTWRKSWFEEDGLRVLYVLPRKWTDEALPLTLQPRPREVVRVMVGRAEIIAPTTEWQLLKQIVRYSDGDADERHQAVNQVRRMNLGRFFQPAVQLVLGSHPNREFSQAAWELVQAATKNDGNGRTLAAK
ncbi:MAG: hypothetical protein DME22_19100 [Verrucomicrobia bacterium]|nr:MAG: hypothetical protein DME22_19100 [Verrucomicrobiota bacterium]